MKCKRTLALPTRGCYTAVHMDEAREKRTFDVFQSHDGTDKPAILPRPETDSP